MFSHTSSLAALVVVGLVAGGIATTAVAIPMVTASTFTPTAAGTAGTGGLVVAVKVEKKVKLKKPGKKPVGAPGPVAGVGLPLLIAALGGYVYIRRHRRG
ncbi:hypothetical protein [Lutibaculum baratangense]|uniref:Uncharacterized protein n=1 Tax=Lutibaculum baratangense AMV1 TaxID=631454 RepID=V4RA63_9HYPH|nr:hypothetical protein [Lutibaculum baratangense]ESR23061.1 hypothetical protein N177_3129 [Lutibaculum baratangense AMV1]